MTVRFGLFGTGPWADEVHAAALAAEPGAELVGVWGRNAAKVRSVAAHWGIRPYDDVDRLIGDVDAIAVALPPDVQARIAERAAAAGRHLLLDKPLALDLAAADRVVAAVESAGVASVVFFTLRFAASTARWLQDTAAAGPWEGLRAAWLSSFLHPDAAQSWDSPWRRERGALWDVGPHALSLAIPLLGPVTDVVAAAGPADTVHLALRHGAAASSVVSLSLTVPPAAAAVDLAVYGARGWWVMPPASDTKVESLRTAVRALVDGAAGGRREHPCDVRFGRDVVAVLQTAAQRLQSSGTPRSANGPGGSG